MNLLKAILQHRVDLIFLLITIGLLVWYFLDLDKNFTGFLLLVAGYITFNVINKGITVMKENTKKNEYNLDLDT